MQNKKIKATPNAYSVMNYGINYGYSVISLPGAVLENLGRAKKRDIYVLIAYLADTTQSLDELAERCSVSEAAVDEALYFWMEAGIIVAPPKSTVESAPEDAESESKEDAAEAADATPDATQESKGAAVSKTEAKARAGDPAGITIDELSTAIEDDDDVAVMIDNCERYCGRIFNTNDVSKLVALKDYLGVTGHYISLVASYCADIGKSATRSIEKEAARLYDQGIRDEKALEQFMVRHYKLTEIEGRLRALFGINMTRALTKKEQRILETWVKTYCYGYDEIKIAYEITVDAIKEPSLSYANAILEKWHSRGLSDAEMILKALEEEAEDKPRDSQSFDSDDFFEAALQRSYRNASSTPPLPPETTPKKTTRRTKK